MGQLALFQFDDLLQFAARRRESPDALIGAAHVDEAVRCPVHAQRTSRKLPHGEGCAAGPRHPPDEAALPEGNVLAVRRKGGSTGAAGVGDLQGLRVPQTAQPYGLSGVADGTAVRGDGDHPVVVGREGEVRRQQNFKPGIQRRRWLRRGKHRPGTQRTEDCDRHQ